MVISRLAVIDNTIRDKDFNLLSEKHTKSRWWCGVRVFHKSYDAKTEIVDTHKKVGYGRV